MAQGPAGLSAGRVQSAALKMIVDREREIDAFQAREYWSLEADLATEAAEGVHARYPVGEKQKFVLGDEGPATAAAEASRAAAWTVARVDKSERKRSAAPPFITSTLQQEASRKLGFSSKRTMAVAQQLYEGIELPGEGSVGLITYMRTDSPALSSAAQDDIAAPGRRALRAATTSSAPSTRPRPSRPRRPTRGSGRPPSPAPPRRSPPTSTRPSASCTT